MNADTAGSAETISVPESRRIFIGLQIRAEVAQELIRLAKPLERPDVQILPLTDIHLTLLPPWNENAIPEAIEKLRRAISGLPPFVLTFEHLSYGPTPSHPRLLWVECGLSHELAALHRALVLAFGQMDDRPFRPHVTIARIRGNGRAIARERPMDQHLTLAQTVDTVELFQSPPPGERGYKVLASLPLERKPTLAPSSR